MTKGPEEEQGKGGGGGGRWCVITTGPHEVKGRKGAEREREMWSNREDGGWGKTGGEGKRAGHVAEAARVVKDINCGRRYSTSPSERESEGADILRGECRIAKASITSRP